MIIGTAGHIDHGKTSLVKALTGIDTDRLPEERRRGITLELGFAHLDLGNGTVAGVVDVPGHERFVKAMIAGAGGVDLALLVIAADEGVMPQTREHLDICRLLGVKAGVVAITKAELLPGSGSDGKQLLLAEIAALVKGSFLEGAPVIACSARTGEGLSDLVAALAQSPCRERSCHGSFFLPIDRVFTLKGFGTVVTGTVRSGELTADAEVRLSPGGDGPLRIRGIQVHGKSVDRVGVGSRAAINLASGEVSRGQVLTLADEPFGTRMLDVELALLPTASAPLPRRRKLILHLGTAQMEAQVALLDVESLAPGETALAQLRLGQPVAALVGQRFVLRGNKLLAGGRVLSVSEVKRRPGSGAALRPLLGTDVAARVGWLLDEAGYAGLTEHALHVKSGLSRPEIREGLKQQSGLASATQSGLARRYFSPKVLFSLRSRARALLQDAFTHEPLREGVSKEELRQKLAKGLAPALFAEVVSSLEGFEDAGDQLRRPGQGLSSAEEAERLRVVETLAQASLAPPGVQELSSRLGIAPARARQLLQLCIHQGAVRRVGDELYFASSALEGLKHQLVGYLKAHPEGISTRSFKEMVGTTRKFVIPLSEYFDREKVTLRVGDKRLLRRG